MSNYKYFLFGVLLITVFAISSESFAAPVQYEATSVGNGRFTTSGFGVPINFKVETAGVPKYKQLIPVTSKTTLGKFAKVALRGGFAGVAITGAVQGYLIDQATGDITKTVQVATGGSYEGSFQAGSGPFRSTPELACQALANMYGTGYTSNFTQTSEVPLRFNCRNYRPNLSLMQTVIMAGTGVFVPAGYVEQSQLISDIEWSQIEDTLPNLSATEKTRLINKILSAVSISGRLDTNGYPFTLGSSNPELNQLYQDWPELRTAVQDLVNAQTSEFLAAENPAHIPTAQEQALADSTSFAPVPETLGESLPQSETELTLESPAAFSASVEPWWVPIYPDGVGGIFTTFINNVSSGPFMAILNPLKTLPDNGSAPIWSMNFDIGVMGNYGTQSFEVPMLVWAFVRFCILFTAVMLVRKLIFGG
jgi:hypothetical protein